MYKLNIILTLCSAGKSVSNKTATSASPSIIDATSSVLEAAISSILESKWKTHISIVHIFFLTKTNFLLSFLLPSLSLDKDSIFNRFNFFNQQKNISAFWSWFHARKKRCQLFVGHKKKEKKICCVKEWSVLMFLFYFLIWIMWQIYILKWTLDTSTTTKFDTFIFGTELRIFM